MPNKMKLTALVSLLILVIVTTPHAYAITAKTNRTLYIPKDSLYVTGTTSASYEVDISITNPNNNLVGTTRGPDDSQGTYNITVIRLPSTNSTTFPYGKYTVRITDTYTGESVITTFIFASQRIILTPSKTLYIADEIVFAYGTAPPEESVSIAVTNPQGSMISVSQGRTDSNGRYNITLFRFPLSSGTTFPYGIYSMRATISSENVSTSRQITFSAKTTPRDPLSKLQQVPVSNPRITDSFGNLISAIRANDLVSIEADVKNDYTRSHAFTYLVQVKDSSSVVDSLGWITGLSLDAGYSLTPGLSWKPSKPGAYTVGVFVWESLTSALPLSPVGRITVNVGV